ncbi:MAG: hypothetical protein ABGY11_03825, partial [Candidatus Thioglobus sp.]
MKKTNITLSIALAAVFSASTAFAEPEVTGKIVHESGFYSEAGSTIGSGTRTLQASGAYADTTNAHAKNDGLKSETSARIYIDGEVNDDATYHVELNLMRDGKGVGKHDGNDSYTQRDALREAYVDTQQGDWAIRAGKQQVVWGTADGMKLLDMINPSDYSEMAQNQMEDSRIPVWMINAEKDMADGSNIQVVVSQPRENVFAGLDRNISTASRGNTDTSTVAAGVTTLLVADITHGGHSTGHAFMMKGVDSITGSKNGMLNIVPDLGGIARRFAWGFGKIGSLNDGRMAGFTVDGFKAMTMGGDNGSMPFAMNNVATANGAGMLCQRTAANLETTIGNVLGCPTNVLNENYGASFGSGSTTVTQNDGQLLTYKALPDAFESAVAGVAANLLGNVTPNATWAADDWADASGTKITRAAVDAKADTLTGEQMLANGFQPYYDTNLSDTLGAGTDAFDYMGSTNFKTFDTFVNAKSKYVYNMPTDSEVDLAFRVKKTLDSGLNYTLNASYNYDKNPIINLKWVDDNGVALTQAWEAGTNKLTLTNAGGTEFGGATDNAATLQFEQKVERAKNFGGSFDMGMETAELGPIVIRGEFLYSKDVYSPIMNKAALKKGDMANALTMAKGDRAKVVLGVDATFLTNMMVSAQFIQDSNLDFVDGAQADGTYTADYATMSILNGFNKATKDKNFYSLFFSKPFGASGEHRWNNITMFEENGGKWNRL